MRPAYRPAQPAAWHDRGMTRAMSHEPGAGRGIERTPWSRRLLTIVMAAVVAVVAYLIAAAVIPRWWAQRVANVVGGSLTVGALYGLFIGFVFTLVPLLVVALAFRFHGARRSWKGWVGWLTVALLLAAPNLMTLGIVLGRGDAAHDGDRILSVEGNGFRMWSLIGAIAAVLAFGALLYLIRSRGWFRDDNRRLRDEAAAGADAAPR